MAKTDDVGTFTCDGVSFRYPENWTLEREDTENGWTVLLQSPGTAFLMVTLDREDPDPDQMTDTALQAMRDDYPQLEAEQIVENIAGRPAMGHDLRFFKFDLLNHCWTRSFATAGGTILLLGQSTDHEGPILPQVLQAILVSLVVEEP